MKIAVLGGGGVRTPLFIKALVKKAAGIKLEELWLHDVDETRLNRIGLVANSMLENVEVPFRIFKTTCSEEAIAGSRFVLSTIRVGGEDGRVLDEEVPLSMGVLGQETTGPGGMAMALRTIPVMLEYARQIENHAPDAWLINFTNPVGMITQALKLHSGVKVVGICDSPVELCRNVAKTMGVPHGALSYGYGGLNHLGWLTSLRAGEKELFPELLKRLVSDDHTQSVFGFASDLICTLGMLPNEYLYYFYYAREAVEHILASRQTRGRQVREMNRTLLSDLGRFGCTEGKAALDTYWNYMGERVSTYMKTETAGEKVQGEMDPEEVGYEGVAIAIMESVVSGRESVMILNAINGNAMPDLEREDVVEVPCRIGPEGLIPVAQGWMPFAAKGLLQQVKAYERLTVEAALEGSRKKAVKALTLHPLVPSFNLAREIVDGYLTVHKRYLPQFLQGQRNGKELP